MGSRGTSALGVIQICNIRDSALGRRMNNSHDCVQLCRAASNLLAADLFELCKGAVAQSEIACASRRALVSRERPHVLLIVHHGTVWGFLEIGHVANDGRHTSRCRRHFRVLANDGELLKVVAHHCGQKHATLRINDIFAVGKHVVTVLPECEIGACCNSVHTIRINWGTLHVDGYDAVLRCCLSVEYITHPGNLRKSAFVRWPLADAILKRIFHLGTRQLDRYDGIFNGKNIHQMPQLETAWSIRVIRSNCAPVKNGQITVGCRPHNVRDEVAEIRLARPHAVIACIKQDCRLSNLLCKLRRHEFCILLHNAKHSHVLDVVLCDIDTLCCHDGLVARGGKAPNLHIPCTLR
eukprot:Opistho-2@50051